MGTFDKRIEEMRSFLKSANGGAEDVIYNTLNVMIGNWAAERELMFDGLVELIKRLGVSRNDNIAEDWKALINTGRTTLKSVFGNGAEDIMMPQGVQLWWTQSLSKEDLYLENLTPIKTPFLTNSIKVQEFTILILTSELDRKWSKLLSEKSEFTSPQLEAMKEIEKIILNILDDMETLFSKVLEELNMLNEYISSFGKILKESFGELLTKFGIEQAKKLILEQVVGINTQSSGDVNKLTGAAADRTAKIVEYLGQQNDLRLAAIRRYRDSLTRQGTIMHMFSENRRQLDEYISTNGISAAEGWRLQAIDEIKKWSASGATDGQKADGATFTELIIAALDDVWNVSKNANNAFEKKFIGMFLGEASIATLDQLTDRFMFKERVDDLVDLDADRKISELPKYFINSVDEKIEQAFEPLTNAATDFPVAARDLLILKSKEFKSFVRESLKSEISDMVNINQKIVDAFTGKEIDTYFFRGDLSKDLD
jgi:hypothetical protein